MLGRFGRECECREVQRVSMCSSHVLAQPQLLNLSEDRVIEKAPAKLSLSAVETF